MHFHNLRGTCRLNYDLKHLTWFKVGGPADVFFKPEDLDDLISFLQQNSQSENTLPLMVIGAGSNIIIRDKGIEGIVIKLGQNFTNIELVSNNLLSAGAGCLNFNLAKFCEANCISGFEFLTGIPGTVGGGVAMNAGCYGSEFKDIVHSTQAVDKNGVLHSFTLADIGFSQRKNSLPKDLIFTKIFFNITRTDTSENIKHKISKLTNKRRASQPVTEKTGGSSFVNPEGCKAWELIDLAGMRGAKIGGASMSALHCNFMINDGTATASDLENLGELIRQKVMETTGIQLQWEIKRVGRS